MYIDREILPEIEWSPFMPQIKIDQMIFDKKILSFFSMPIQICDLSAVEFITKIVDTIEYVYHLIYMQRFSLIQFITITNMICKSGLSNIYVARPTFEH